MLSLAHACPRRFGPRAACCFGAALFFAEPAVAFAGDTCNAAAKQAARWTHRAARRRVETLSWAAAVRALQSWTRTARRGEAFHYPVFDANRADRLPAVARRSTGRRRAPLLSLWDMGESRCPDRLQDARLTPTGPERHAWILRERLAVHRRRFAFRHTTWTFDSSTGTPSGRGRPSAMPSASI